MTATVFLSPTPMQRFVDSNGNALVGGKLFTYQAGTTTKYPTYTDSTGAVQNTNPIVLNQRGEASIWVDQTQSYKFVLSPANDTDPPTSPIWTQNNISGLNSTGVFTFFGVDSGTANAYEVATTQPVSGLTDGLRIFFTALNSNTGPATLQVNSNTNVALLGKNDAALIGGEMIAGNAIEAVFVESLNSFVLVSSTGALSAHQIQGLTASVASNALTATLSPTILDFRSATLPTGLVATIAIPSAISIVIPSGATLGTVSGVQSRLIFLVADNGGVPVLCVANLSGGVNLDETTLISPTTISSGATSSGVIYSASAVAANSTYRVVGFCDVSEVTAGTWATAPVRSQGTGGQALAALSSIGYGQQVVDVTASRSLATTYYNTTGKPIIISGYAINVSGGVLALTINGIQQWAFAAASGSPEMPFMGLVPAGGNYVLTNAGGTFNLSPGTGIWTETR